MALTRAQRIVHFLNRTSFGVTPAALARVERIGIPAYLEEQLAPEAIPDSPVEEKVAALKTMRMSSAELYELYPPANVLKQRGEAMNPMSAPRVIIFELQQARLLRAVESRRQLYELMVDFWSNHFNVFAGKGADRWLMTAYDRDTIRPHALGKFADLLRATAQSPAMLFYLDNWLSVSPHAPAPRVAANVRRRGINENYAREIMELHTIGAEGGYTQGDVHEVARCFTGWTVRRPRGQAEFYFAPRLHDPGEKNVLGARIAAGGMADGLQVIDLLARHPATARLIAAKLARRFVADDPPAALVERAAAEFRRSDGDIRSVLRSIVEAPEFFAPEFFRAKVRKPLEYVAGALRSMEAEIEVTPQLLRYLARMGEPLFLAQPPTGFPDAGAFWTSPDMLLTRMNFAADLAANRINGARVKTEFAADAPRLARLAAGERLSPATRAALAGAQGSDGVALLLAAPEFQRR